MKVVLFVAVLFALPVFAGNSHQPLESAQIESSQVGASGGNRALLAMGPDPGGHTGATVTPETTRTGNTAVDAAREAASAGKTENSAPAVNAVGKMKN